MLLQLMEGHPPTRISLIAMLMMLMMLMMMTTKVISKPQVSTGFVNGISDALPMAGKMGTARFAKANLPTAMGVGAAVSYEEKRRKRSMPIPSIDNSLLGEETILPLPLYHQHLHRDKRTPCYYGGSGAGGSGAGGGGTGGGGAGAGGADGGGDGTVVDDIARRRRANQRKRLAEAKKKAQARKKAIDSRKKKFTNDDDNVEEPLSRRKRQSEVDDLNDNMENNGSKDFSQHVQKVAEKMQAIWQQFMQSMNNMAERIKQHFDDKNSLNATEV